MIKLLAGIMIGATGALANAQEALNYSADEIAIIGSLRLSQLPPPSDSTNKYFTDPKAKLIGRQLFFFSGLSPGGDIGCANCHDALKGWADGHEVAQGTSIGSRNTLSLLNSVHQRWLMWDGSADTLWGQALKPIENPQEMGADREFVLCQIWSNNSLRHNYEVVFGEVSDNLVELVCTHSSRQDLIAKNLTDRHFSNIGKAIAAHVGTIISRGSRFDIFAEKLFGERIAYNHVLTVNEQRGLKLFIGKAKCITCHHSPLFSDGEFHNLMLPLARNNFPSDIGRYGGIKAVRQDQFGASGSYSDDSRSVRSLFTTRLRQSPHNIGQFRTPSLRNVSKTSPYMHDGQFKSLHDVLNYYSTLKGAQRADHHQETVIQPLGLTTEEIEHLVAFLISLDEIEPPM